MSMTDADFVALARAMHCNPYTSSDTEDIALLTVLLGETGKQNTDYEYLFHSDLSCCDVIIFSCFLISYLCANETKNRKNAEDFATKYISMVMTGGDYLYAGRRPSFIDMFASRADFYNKICAVGDNQDDNIHVLVEIFIRILLMDAGNNTFEVFDENSSYTVAGVFSESQCRTEATTFLGGLPTIMSPTLQRIQKNLREGRDADGREHMDVSAHPAQQPTEAQPQQAASAPRPSPHGKHEAAKKATPAPAPSQRPRADIHKNPNQYENIQPELKKEYDHINFTSSSHKAPAQTKVQRVPFPYGFVITLVLLIAVAVVGSLSDTSSSGSQEQTVSDTFVQPTHTLNPEYEYIPVSETEMEPVDISNGEQFEFPRDEQLAPFEVSAPQSANCYVRLHSFRRPYNDVSFYVSQGSTYEILVPLGTYYLYYATGETWYGDDAPDNMVFGEDTTWSRSEDVFEFTDDGEYYNGYTITLYAVPNGNLDTDYVSTEDIPF